jgi:protein-S-isoprenylcysteine O-methyltransferase Ste14
MGVVSKPMLALALAGGVLVYLGLAILGWGGFDAFFSNPARTALVIATAAMVIAASFSSGNLSAGEREDRSNRWVIGALGLIGLLSAWLPAYTDTLVTDGIYSVVRNPSYLGLLVLSLGWALAFRSVVGVLLAALNIVPLVARIRAEEELLRSQFGTEYEAYRARTWRLLPGLY